VREGKTVVRLKGGDPFIFGRGGEEAEALADNNIRFEVVPGVSAATAVPTYAGIPLTHRDHNASVAFVTGHEDPAKPESKVHWDRIATGVGTIVFFMGMKNLPNIIENLIKYGRDPETPVAVIQWGTRADQKVVTGVLKDITAKVKEAAIGPPAIIVVGEVVKLRYKLNWFEAMPLFGKRIMIIGSRDQTGAIAESLTECAAIAIEVPVVDVVSPADWGQLDDVLNAIGTFNWIMFRDGDAATFFFDRLWNLGKDVRILKHASLAAIEPEATKVLKRYGIKADLVIDEFTAEGIITAFHDITFNKQNILIPLAKAAVETVSSKLRELGAEVTVAAAYEEVKPVIDAAHILKLLKANKIAIIAFTSAPAVHAFAEMFANTDYKLLIGNTCIACIGTHTVKAADDHGLHADIVPKNHSREALVEALTEYFMRKG